MVIVSKGDLITQKLISELTVMLAEVFRPLDVDELELSPGKTYTCINVYTLYIYMYTYFAD